MLCIIIYGPWFLNNIRTGQEAVEWVVNFHNSVNVLNGKRIHTVQEAQTEFEARYMRPIMNNLLAARSNQLKKNKKKKQTSKKMYPGFFTPLWDTMMIVARALPHDKLDESRKLAFIRFIEGLLPLIPCPGCSLHAMYYYMNHRLNDIQTGQEAYEWIITFHNDVNKRNGKREYTVKEASEALDARLNGEMKDLVRSEVRQKEDHKKIKELSDELKIFRNIPHATTNEALFGYILAALIVGVVVLFLLIVFFAVAMRQFKHVLSVSRKEETPIIVASASE